MVAVKPLYALVLAIMIAITVLNLGLVINFAAASGNALVALFRDWAPERVKVLIRLTCAVGVRLVGNYACAGKACCL